LIFCRSSVSFSHEFWFPKRFGRTSNAEERRTGSDLSSSYAFFERCDDYDKGAVDSLLIDRTRHGMQDRGEAEAVEQASQWGAAVIVDDAWGCALAGNFDLEVHGTVWVLKRFRELELISSTAFRECFVSLRKRGTRLPWEAVNQLLRESGEIPL
jgi:hypothetical protein